MPAATVAPAHKGGGTDTYVRSLFQIAQQRSDISLDVVSLAPDGPLLDPPPGTRIFYLRSKLLLRLLFFFREGRNPVANVVLLVTTGIALGVKGLLLAARERYDLIYGVGGPIAGAASALVGNLRGIPAAVHFHWAYRFAASNPLVRVLARRFYERFALVIGNSRLLGRDGAALGVRRTRFVCVYNWVDAETFRPLGDHDALRRKWDLPPGGFVFLYVGRFDWSKQVDILVAALKAHRYEATFVFAGDGTLAPQLHEAAAINDIRLVGTRGPAELAELHNVADVLLWGSVDVDYPGLVVMEAMASGLPVVTSNSSMNPLYWGVPVDDDILGGPALTQHFPATPAGVDEAIRHSLAHRDELASLRGRARAFALQRFGRVNAEALLDLLVSFDCA